MASTSPVWWQLINSWVLNQAYFWSNPDISRICILAIVLGVINFAGLALFPASRGGFDCLFYILCHTRDTYTINRNAEGLLIGWSQSQNEKHFSCLQILSVYFRCFSKHWLKLLYLIASLLLLSQSSIYSKVSEQMLPRQVEEIWNSFENKTWSLSRISDLL